MSDDQDKNKLCPDGIRHRWKDLRSYKLKEPGPPFYFFQRCKRCCALKTQVVSAEAQKNGDIVPKVSQNVEAGDLFWKKDSPTEKTAVGQKSVTKA